MALDQLPGAQGLKQKCAFLKAVFLGRFIVELGNGRVEFRRLLIHAPFPWGWPNYTRHFAVLALDS